MKKVKFNLWTILCLIILILIGCYNKIQDTETDKMQSQNKPSTGDNLQTYSYPQNQANIEPEALNDLEKLKQENQTLEEIIRKKNEKIDNYFEITTEVSKKLDAINTTFIENLNHTEEGFDCRNFRDRLLEKIKQVNDIVDSYQKKVVELELSKKEMEQFDFLISRLRLEISTKEMQIRQLKGDNRTIEQRFHSLCRLNEDLYKSYFLKNEKLTLSENEIIRLKKDINRLNEDLKQVKLKADGKIVYISTPHHVEEKYIQPDDPNLPFIGSKPSFSSQHPADSYIIIDTQRRHHTLKILDWKKFWKSNYAIIHCRR